MKKLSIMATAAAIMLLCACDATSLSGTASALGGAINGNVVGNVLTSVLGVDKVTASQLVGTWQYQQPGCAFTSQELLAKAGGEVVAGQIKEKLSTYYATAGIKSSNTSATFSADGKCSLVVAGKTLSGTYTYNESEGRISIKTLLLNINCYTKRNTTGIALLFEASKLLTVMQTAAALSGNTSLQGVGELSKAYDGLRIGFDMRK